MNALEAMALSQQRWLMQYWDHASPDDWASVLATFSLFSGRRWASSTAALVRRQLSRRRNCT
jgi:hypothetical protein